MRNPVYLGGPGDRWTWPRGVRDPADDDMERESCPWCNGTGQAVMDADTRCGYCNGHGYVLVEQESFEDRL